MATIRRAVAAAAARSDVRRSACESRYSTSTFVGLWAVTSSRTPRARLASSDESVFSSALAQRSLKVRLRGRNLTASPYAFAASSQRCRPSYICPRFP